MDLTQDIQSAASLRSHTDDFVERVKRTRRPLVLTVNGEAAAVMLYAESYQRLLDIAAEASVEEGNRQARDDIAAGRTRPAEDVFAELRAEYDIPR